MLQPTTTAVYTTTSASSALSNIQTAIQNLADMRARIGANIQRLNVTRSQVGLLNENLAETNSRILDTDVAERKPPSMPASTLSSRAEPPCSPRQTSCLRRLFN